MGEEQDLHSRSWRIRRHSLPRSINGHFRLSATRRRRQGWPTIPITQRTSGSTIECRCLFSISCQTWGRSRCPCKSGLALQHWPVEYCLLRFEQGDTGRMCSSSELLKSRRMCDKKGCVSTFYLGCLRDRSRHLSWKTLRPRTSHQFLRLAIHLKPVAGYSR